MKVKGKEVLKWLEKEKKELIRVRDSKLSECIERFSKSGIKKIVRKGWKIGEERWSGVERKDNEEIDEKKMGEGWLLKMNGGKKKVGKLGKMKGLEG